MMASKVYHAVLMDGDNQMVGQLDTPINTRYVVLVPTDETIVVLAGDEAPNLDELPVSSRVFHRIGSAVWTSENEASSMYELLGERL